MHQQGCKETLSGKMRLPLVLDAKRAFLYADAPTETYVKPLHFVGTDRCCWRLKKCVYGMSPA